MIEFTRAFPLKYYHHLVTIQHHCDDKLSVIINWISLFLPGTLKQYSLTDNMIKDWRAVLSCATLKPHRRVFKF